MTYRELSFHLRVHWSTVRNWILGKRLGCRARMLPKLIDFLEKGENDIVSQSHNTRSSELDDNISKRNHLLLCRLFSLYFQRTNCKSGANADVEKCVSEIRNAIAEVSNILSERKRDS